MIKYLKDKAEQKKAKVAQEGQEPAFMLKDAPISIWQASIDVSTAQDPTLLPDVGPPPKKKRKPVLPS